MSSQTLKELNQNYIKLCFSLDNLIGKGSVVDSYVGDLTIKESDLIKDKGLIVPLVKNLEKRACEYSAENKDESLIDFISAVKSIRFLAESLLNQSDRNYSKQINNIYQTPLIKPTNVEIESLKAEIILNLKKLGYNDPWPRCYQDWNKDNLVSGKEYFKILKKQSVILEDLTFEKLIQPFLGKSASEILRRVSKVEYELVDTNELWNAYHYYSKGYQSEVKINKNNSFNKHEALFLAAHEIFPGHHTHAIIREYCYNLGELGLSSSINILSSPFSLISEGIADFGYCFFGIEYTVDQKIMHNYRRLLKTLRHKLAIEIINGKLEPNEGVRLLKEEIGSTSKEAEKPIKAAIGKWKFYFPCYYMGFQVVEAIFKSTGLRSIQSLYKYSDIKLIKKISLE